MATFKSSSRKYCHKNKVKKRQCSCSPLLNRSVKVDCNLILSSTFVCILKACKPFQIHLICFIFIQEIVAAALLGPTKKSFTCRVERFYACTDVYFLFILLYLIFPALANNSKPLFQIKLHNTVAHLDCKRL